MFLLRSTFFSDRWAWIFGATFHFGLFLVLVRHLRFFLEPAWLRPLWQPLMWAQPFGYYAGFALPAGPRRGGSARHGWATGGSAPRGSITSCWRCWWSFPSSDTSIRFVRTDLIAVKDFMEGLLTFDLKPLPADPVLLTHLWLVALLMILLPFSRLLLLLPFGHVLHVPGFLDPEENPRAPAADHRMGRRPSSCSLLLGAPAAIAAAQVAKEGMRPAPAFANLANAHSNDPSTVMIRFHPRFLFTHRVAVVHQGQRRTGRQHQALRLLPRHRGRRRNSGRLRRSQAFLRELPPARGRHHRLLRMSQLPCAQAGERAAIDQGLREAAAARRRRRGAKP